MSGRKEESSSSGWMWLGLLVIGIIFGVGPFRNAKCSSNEPKIETQTQKEWDGSFTGRKYDCEGGMCFCERYEKKSTYNTDCKCGHPKNWHHSQK